MEVTQGCIHLQLLLQRICCPPFRLVILNENLHMISTLDTKTYPRAIKLWITSKIIIGYAVIFCTFQIALLFRNWKVGNNAEQLCVCTLILGLCSIGMFALRTMQERGEEVIITNIRCLKFAGFRVTSPPSIRRVPALKENLIYVLFGGTLFALLATATVGSFFLDYLFVKLTGTFLLEKAWPQLPLSLPFYCDISLNLLSTLYLRFAILHTGGNGVHLLLSLTIFCEALNSMTLKLFEKTPFFAFTQCRDATSTDKPQRKELSFVECFKLYRIIQVLMWTMNEAADGFVQPLIVMGILSAAASGYTCIKLGGIIPPVVYSGLSLILPVSLIVNFVLIALAAVPNKNATTFKRFWTSRATRKFNRLALQSCPPIGYSYGFVETLRMKTALTITDIIINLVATLTLLS